MVGGSDILPALTCRASRTARVAVPVRSEEGEPTICDRRRWLCHEAVTWWFIRVIEP